MPGPNATGGAAPNLGSARQTAGDIADWAARVSADPDRYTQAARKLATSATRAEIESAELDDLYVARLRSEVETHMNADPGYPDPATGTRASPGRARPATRHLNQNRTSSVTHRKQHDCPSRKQTRRLVSASRRAGPDAPRSRSPAGLLAAPFALELAR
jgi:hypothetical protein